MHNGLTGISVAHMKNTATSLIALTELACLALPSLLLPVNLPPHL